MMITHSPAPVTRAVSELYFIDIFISILSTILVDFHCTLGTYFSFS